jgi:hypothetical protein
MPGASESSSSGLAGWSRSWASSGVVSYSLLWATSEIDADQGIGLILGTALAVVLSATSYRAGINLGLRAERLNLAANDF